ncbi:MAG: acyl-CoA dehydrogenase family protein [Proteobacteria bacterium]|nr:acyl-CoA dehydrogenase family protein [Pseudomonadota bacterium]
MALPDRNNPYSFDAFLEWRNHVNYYQDDLFFRKTVRHFVGGEWEKIDKAAKALSEKVSFRWRDFADTIATPDKRPYMTHYDGHNHRIDRIVRPAETLIMEKEVFGEGLFSKKTSPWEKLVKMYLIYQNSEAGVVCPLTCTEGLVELMRAFSRTPELETILGHLSEGMDGDFAIGAQYLSEIQGGSDVPANLLEAVPENGLFRLYGKKFFCSATHADYAVVTAKPVGSEKIGLFIVPSWLPRDKEKEIRNGYTIDRIKWKMGTCELPTAEITYNGAVAYPIGPLERGLANVVGIVLTYSRLTVGIGGAAGMARAVREAKRYAAFRTAFGVPIDQFPMLANQLEQMEWCAKRTTAGAFKLYQSFLRFRDGLNQKLDGRGNVPLQKDRFNVRELIMLQKIATTKDVLDMSRLGMSVYGGHGVMEDFSSMPRMFRDGMINELWEGPRNVLLTQIYLDFHKVREWYSPKEFVRNILKDSDESIVETLEEEIHQLISHGTLLQMDEETKKVCSRWDQFCHDLFHAYQNQALKEVEKDG